MTGPLSANTDGSPASNNMNWRKPSKETSDISERWLDLCLLTLMVAPPLTTWTEESRPKKQATRFVVKVCGVWDAMILMRCEVTVWFWWGDAMILMRWRYDFDEMRGDGIILVRWRYDFDEMTLWFWWDSRWRYNFGEVTLWFWWDSR